MRTNCSIGNKKLPQQPLSLFWVTVVVACSVLALISCVATVTAQEALGNPEGVVAFCFDGDTVKLTDRRIVRIAGIDTPEIQHGQNSAQYYSREARSILESIVKGKKVLLRLAGNPIRDHYGRTLAELILEDGTSVNEIMIAKGAAFYYPHTDLLPELKERLLLEQKHAISKRSGMWDTLFNKPLAKKQYIGNRASMRFFPVDCPETKRIKPRNKVMFGTLMDAFSAGFAPARICPFWPTEP